MKKIIEYGLILLVILIQVLDQVLLFNIPIYIPIFLYLMIFFLSNKSDILPQYLLLIFLSSGVVLYILNVIFVITLIFKFRKNIELNKFIYIYIILLLIELLHIIVNLNSGYNESIIYFFGFSLCFLPFFLIENISKFISIKKCYHYFLFGFLAFSAILLLIYSFQYGLNNYFNLIKRFGFLPGLDDDGALQINPNTIGKYAGLAFVTTIILLKYKVLKYNIVYFLALFISFTIGLLTFSRAFILIILIIGLTWIILNFKFSFKSFIVLFNSILIFLIMNLVVYIANPNIYDAIYERIFVTEDVSGNRLIIYKLYLDIIFNNLNIFLFGTGMQDYIDKFNDINILISNSSHNVFIEIISIWGIVGLSLVLILFFKLLNNKRTIDFGREKLILVLPFLVIFISAQFGQYFISFYHTFGITYFALLFLYKKEIIYD